LSFARSYPCRQPAPRCYPFAQRSANEGSELLISRSLNEPEGHVARALLPARLCGIIGGQECPPHKRRNTVARALLPARMCGGIAKAAGTSERSATWASSCGSIGGQECPSIQRISSLSVLFLDNSGVLRLSLIFLSREGQRSM
jgi:hypothetical protein